MNKSIKLAEPFIKKNDSLSILKKVLKSNYINEGRLTRDFEKKISKLLKIKYVTTCTSGTTAIFLALKSIGIKNNDEVLVPNLTFPGTVNAVSLAGAKPVLVDIKNDCMRDPLHKGLRKAISFTWYMQTSHFYGSY